MRRGGAVGRFASTGLLILTTVHSAGADPSKSRLRKAVDRIVERFALAHAFWERESLAVAGVDGTLEEGMRGTPAEGRVVAKTGTLRRVNGLAGHVTTVRGERLAFVLLVNNQVDLSGVARAAIDDVAIALAVAR